MLKSIVLCVLLWHEMCQCSYQAKRFFNDTSIPNFRGIVSPRFNDIDIHSDKQETAPLRNCSDTNNTIDALSGQIKPNMNYNFNAPHQIFHLNIPSVGGAGVGCNLNSSEKVPRTDNLVANGIGAHKGHICIVNDTDMQSTPNMNYNFNAAHQVFYVNGPLLGRADCDRNLKSSANVPRADYLVTNGIGAHKLHTVTTKWSTARRICVDEGGHLAVIRSKSEENIILKMMTDRSVASAWVGFHDQFAEGDWISVLDEPLSKIGWTHWSSKFKVNPDNSRGTQHCAYLLRDGGGMDDYQCDSSLAFVCKISTI